jgi:hypothetical protein
VLLFALLELTAIITKLARKKVQVLMQQLFSSLLMTLCYIIHH